MTRINTNIGALRGLRNVAKSNQALQTSLQRLSTGIKINNGADNPSGLVAGESLRLQITTIDQSIKNSNRANNVISTADSALGEIGGLLNQVRGLVQEGLNVGALSQDETDANQSQIDAALSAINRISANTSFAGDKLLDGSKAFTTSVSTTDAAKLSDYQVNEALFGSAASVNLSAKVTSAAEKAQLKYSGGALTSPTTIQVAGARGSQVLFLGGSSSVSNIAEAVNGISDVTGVKASVIAAAPGELTVSNATAGSTTVGNTQAAEATLTTAGTVNVNRNAQAGRYIQAGTLSTQLVFSDARATATDGAPATLGGQVSVNLVNTASSLAASTVAGVAVDGNGDYTVTINLRDDGVNSTANLADIQAAIAAHAGASALVTATSQAAGGYGTANAASVFAASGGAQQLTGGQDTANNDLTFTDIRAVATRDDYNVAVALNATAASQALGITVDTDTFGNQTVNVSLATDAQGRVTTTAAQLKTFFDTDAGAGATAARALLSVDDSGNGSGTLAAAGEQALSDVTNSSFTATDGRATDSNAVFTNPLSLTLANAGVNQTLSASFVAAGDGGALTINLATDANGNITSTANDIKTLLANHANPNISQYEIEVSGDGTGVVQAFSSTDLTGADNLANSDLTFTDARATNSVGEFATSVSVQFLNGGANQSLSASVSSDASGNKTVTINLATDANGAITSTAANVATFLANDASAGAVEARTLVDVTASGTGAGVLKTKGPQALTGGANGANNDVAFTDVRTGTQTQAINVAFADPGANNSALSISTTIDGNGDHLITVNLATNGSGVITTTAAQLATFLNTDSSAGAVAARALVSADDSGDGTGVVAARSAAALTATTGSDVLVLESDDFGSKQSVSITTLSGTFATTLGDGVTSAARDVGLDIGVQINGQAATGDGLKASVKTATLDASVSFKEANNAVNQSSTISITGGGATFQIGQEVSAAGQVGIGIEAVNTARLGGVTGKLYELGSGSGKSLVDLRNGVTGAGPRISAKDLTDIIDQALNRVTSLRGRLGSIQKNVIETNISTLGVALENITEARSQIVDTDFAEETAALQRNQVLSQAGISVLGIANQNPQQVLSLLR